MLILVSEPVQLVPNISQIPATSPGEMNASKVHGLLTEHGVEKIYLYAITHVEPVKEVIVRLAHGHPILLAHYGVKAVRSISACLAQIEPVFANSDPALIDIITKSFDSIKDRIVEIICKEWESSIF